MMKKLNVRQHILQLAERFIQTQGYNAFSYRDIADDMGIKTSSIHYYFPTKADLGRAVVKQHIEQLSHELDELMQNKVINDRDKLALFFDRIFELTYHSSRKMCLGGMLASDVLTLPEEIQHEVRLFFQHIESWLNELLKQGIKNNVFKPVKDSRLEVALTLSILEGALLLARLYQDETRLAQAKEAVLLRLTSHT